MKKKVCSKQKSINLGYWNGGKRYVWVQTKHQKLVRYNLQIKLGLEGDSWFCNFIF